MAWLSTADSKSYGVYSYACICQPNIEDFVVEIHYGGFLYFPFHVKNSKKMKSCFTRYIVSSAKTLILACV